MNPTTIKSTDSAYKAIILPFQSRWHESVIAGKVSAVFRKKGPAPSASPKWAYAYFGAPISAICAKLQIDRVQQLSVDKAASFCNAGGLTEAELRDYVGNTDSVFVFEIAKCEALKRSIGMDELRERFGFQPTPSFMALSNEGMSQLDSLSKTKVTK